MLFARRVFRIAGIYGLLVLVPQYFLEAKTGADYPPPITHPEFYYGFIGVALSWQVAFLILSTDPARYRPLIVPAILEKASFAIAAATLFGLGRVNAMMLGAGAIDLAWGVLFVVAYLRTAPPPA